MSLREDGKNDAAFMVGQTIKSPTHASKLRRLSGLADEMTSVPSKPVKLPTRVEPDEALAEILGSHMKVDDYKHMRLTSKAHFADIWPIYDDVLAEKEKCRPEKISATESAVTVPLNERLKQNGNK